MVPARTIVWPSKRPGALSTSVGDRSRAATTPGTSRISPVRPAARTRASVIGAGLLVAPRLQARGVGLLVSVVGLPILIVLGSLVVLLRLDRRVAAARLDVRLTGRGRLGPRLCPGGRHRLRARSLRRGRERRGGLGRRSGSRCCSDLL